MDGVLIVDKPAGVTSHDVVARVRRILKTKRVGHTGTLDPFATGVMVILIGKGTRLAQFLDKDEKEYEAEVKFGFETDTGDATGVRNAEFGTNEQIAATLKAAEWENVLQAFRGEIKQVPPMYSAKKIGGKKLYESARKGQVVDRKAVRVNIRELEMLDLRIPHSVLRIKVACSAGTYVRTLAEDIGRRLGTGAHLAALRRTRAGRFDLSQSITLDDLETLRDPDSRLLPVDDAVSHLPAVTLAPERAEATKSGLSTRIMDSAFADGEAVRMLDDTQILLAVGVYHHDENSIRPKVVLV